MRNPVFRSKLGRLYCADSFKYVRSYLRKRLEGKVNLIITSPPFALNKKKAYGNLQGEAYKEWFTSLGPLLSDLLTDDGSLVIELGNAWEPGRPVQSTLPLECLLRLVSSEESPLRLIQEFICYNPSRLPSPAQWVTVNRMRTVDSFTHVWWMAKSDTPKADNTKVLRPYSKSMKQLLKRKKYNAGKRPSQFDISEKGFLKDHGGSISHNFLEFEAMDSNREPRLPFNAFSFANTTSNDPYMKACREHNIIPHPARMQSRLVNFFINYLTEPGDLILDPFMGSGTSAICAELLKRNWIGIEIFEEYIEHIKLRFQSTSNED